MRRTDKFNANSSKLRETREKLSRTDAFYVASNGANQNIAHDYYFSRVIIGRVIIRFCH